MIRLASRTCFRRKLKRGSDMCDFVAVKVGSPPPGKAPLFPIMCAWKRKTSATLTRARTPSDTVVGRLNIVRSTKLFLGKAYGTGLCILLNCFG